MTSTAQQELKNLKKRIDELEQENQYLRQIIAHMPGNVFWKDRKGVFLACNDNVVKLLNAKSQDEVLGKTLYDFSDKNLCDYIKKIDDKIMKAGKEISLEEEAFKVGGDPAIYLTHKAPLVDRKGKITGLFGVSLDITRLKNTEKALVEAKEKAEAASRAKSEFLTNISHDLLTPFNGILSFCESLFATEKDLKKKDMLECMCISTRTLIKIVYEILEFSRTETDKLPVHVDKINIREIVNNVRSLLITQLKEKNLNLIINCSNTVPNVLIGDEVRISRILLNLVSNAIKFTDKGFVKIELDVLETPKNMKILTLKVSDSGIGFKSDQYEIIFDKFSRLIASDCSDYEGLGLGLYIVKKFVTEIGGDIHVESELGKGTTFTCHLKLF